jgi:acetate kinase
MMDILCVNCGSSSLKFAVYRCEDGQEHLCLQGAVEGVSTGRGRLWIQRSTDPHPQELAQVCHSHSEAFDAAMNSLAKLDLPPLAAIGHRVVHGGEQFDRPQLIDTPVLTTLQSLVPFAPLHMPPQIAAIEAAKRRFPDSPHVACFDTAFFRSMPEIAQRYPLPGSLWDAGVRRYGFHGLSYESILTTHPEARRGRTIIAHLGNGCSLTALRDGLPVETTMGFTPAGGVVMGSRSGDLDPGVLIYLMDHMRYGPRDIERLVNQESGLKGISGLTSEMQTLLSAQSTNPQAALAIDIYCHSIRKQIGAFAAVLGGLDRLIFTAGIGERAAAVRRQICHGLEYLGIEWSESANLRGERRISTEDSRIAVEVIATNEQQMIARHSAAFITTGMTRS